MNLILWPGNDDAVCLQLAVASVFEVSQQLVYLLLYDLII